MKKIKKPISVLLAMLMVFSLFTIVPITASAESGYTFDPETGELHFGSGTYNFSSIHSTSNNTYTYNGFAANSVKTVTADEDVAFEGNCNSMFSSLSECTSIDLSNVDMSQVTYMSSMFYGCSSLTNLSFGDIDTSSVTSMESMFRNCSSLENLDVSSFNTESVNDMSFMFYNCSSLKRLNLSSFDTSNVKKMKSMFFNCSALTTIIADIWWDVSNVTDSGFMFSGCLSLVGGNGTVYSAALPTDKELARIDDVSRRGYLTKNACVITWKNEDGSVLGTSSRPYGMSPVYEGNEPTKDANAQYTYTFIGWSDGENTYAADNLPPAVCPMTYTAQFSATTNKYTITWLNDDGTLIDTTTVAYGTVPTHADPTKAATAQYTYTFSGWSPAILPVTGDVTYTATYTKAPLAAHFSQDGDVYTIHDAAGWDVFCDLLAENANGYFTGKTVILGNDISVNRQAGISNHDFTGTFDGNGKTLTFNYTGSKNFIAPFYATGDGTSPYFRNLTVNGTINSTGKYAAGLIGHLYGNVTIENCKSEIDITSAENSGGFVGLCEHTVNFTNCLSSTVIHSEGTCNSGFVGWSRANGYEINFTGCLFNGKLLQKNGQGSENGGFIGWTGSNKTVTINNSVCAPAALSSGETMASGKSATFARGWNDTTTAANSYYITALGSAQAKAAHSVTAGSNVTLALSGTATEYNVSGITAYENNSGLKYGDTIYAGNGDSVSLTLGHNTPTGYSTAYTASAGTLVNGVLTMPDSNVVISAADTQNDYTITTTSEHGTVIAAVGETQNAASAHYGDTVTLTVTANTGYKLTSLTVKDASNNNVTVTENNNGTYSFDMPASNVTVTADFDVESYFDSTTGTLHLKGTLFSTSGSGIVLPKGVSKDDVLHIDVDDAGATLPSNSSFMFYEFKNVITIDLTGADTSGVTSMTNMFGFCYALTSLNLTGFDTSQVTGMSYMFNGCRSLTSVDVSGFDTSKVAGMLNMFYGCQSLNTLNLSSFDTSKVWNMYNMFRNCENLETIYVSNKWTTDSVTSSDNMFTNCTHLTGGNGTTFDSSKIDKTYARIDKDGQPGYLTGTYTLTLPDNMAIVTDASADKKVGNRYLNNAVVTFKVKTGYIVNGDVTANGTTLTAENGIYTLYVTDNMTVSADVDVESYFDSTTGTLTLKGTVLKNSVSWGSVILPYGVNKSDVLHIVVDTDGATLPQDSSCLFYEFSNVQSIDLTRANTSNVTDMNSMFLNCQALTSLDLSSFNTSSVTDMSYMFVSCTALTTLNLSSFNTSSVTNMDSMFYNCQALTSLDLSSFDTSRVTNMRCMFYYCHSLETLDLSSFDTSSVMHMEAMFAMDNTSNRLTTIYVGKNWSTENIAPCGNMFDRCTHLTGGNGTAFNGRNTDNTYARIDKDGQPGYFTGLYNLTLPENMEIVTDDAENKVGNRYLSGAEVTFKVKTGYGADNVKANGTVLTATDGIYTLTVTDDTEITATIVEYTPVVINSVDINGIITPTTVYKEIYASTDYTVPASPYLDGYTFSGWKVNNGEILSTPEAVQTAVENLVKDGTPVTVSVVYTKKEDTHTVSVNAPETVGCTIKDADGNVIPAGTSVNVSEQLYAYADQNAPGQHFAYWLRIQGDKQTIVGYETTYAFHMPDEDMVLSAVYVDNDVEVEKVGTAFIESVTTINGNKIAFVSKLSVPEGARILKAGIVANTEAKLNGSELTSETAQFTRYNSSDCYNYLAYKYTWTKGNVNADDIWCVRSYLVYKDENGGEHTVYGELVRANLNGIITEQ